jgi:hypothetical protein
MLIKLMDGPEGPAAGFQVSGHTLLQQVDQPRSCAQHENNPAQCWDPCTEPNFILPIPANFGE